MDIRSSIWIALRVYFLVGLIGSCIRPSVSFMFALEISIYGTGPTGCAKHWPMLSHCTMWSSQCPIAVVLSGWCTRVTVKPARALLGNHIMITVGLVYEDNGCTNICITERSSSLMCCIITYVIMHECEWAKQCLQRRTPYYLLWFSPFWCLCVCALRFFVGHFFRK